MFEKYSIMVDFAVGAFLIYEYALAPLEKVAGIVTIHGSSFLI